jgi:NAD-dependent deacetylase
LPAVQITDELILAIQTAEQIAILTGSGISVESGVPTFREAQTGLWAQYDPELLATPDAFQRNPKLVWDWYRWRRQLVNQAIPNIGHMALVEMEELVHSFSLITQNVDGLHQAAGSSNVIELHGNIMRSKCSRDGKIVEEVLDLPDALPRCPECSDLLRPDVVWFGETLPQDYFHRALIAARSCSLFFSIGTSAVVHPASSLAGEARNNGARIVEINIEATPLSPYADFVLRGTAGDVLPMLVESIRR